MKGLFVAASALALVAAIGCSSSSSSGGGDYGLPPACISNSDSMVNEACAGCLQSNCGSSYSSFTSACYSYLACDCACTGSNAASCETSCGTPDSACISALGGIESCEMSHCSSQCGSSTTSPGDAGGTSGGGDSGASCSSLSSCCGMLSSAEQTGCNDVVTAGIGADCQSALSAYMASNMCK